MLDRMAAALAGLDADYAEIRLTEEEGVFLSLRGAETESAATHVRAGGVARACVRGGWGVVAFDDLTDLGAPLREAVACARAVGRETTQLAEVEPVLLDKPAEMARDFRGVPLDEKLRVLNAYNEILRKADAAIQSTQVYYADNYRTVSFASTTGHRFREERPTVRLSISARARDGTNVQGAHESWSSPCDYGIVENRQANAEAVARRAVDLLSAPKPAGGPTTVILDPRLAGVFVHEAFGHLSEADFLYENPRMKDLLHLGRRVGPKHLNIVDDGTMPGLVGSLAVDDEGTPAQRVPLVTEGELTAHLHSRETAARMGEAPTGNARAKDRRHPPIVRMRNTFIENGTLALDQLFAGVEDGIYALDAFGGQTEFEMFTFSAAYGYRIRNGQRAELVRDVVLSGNVFETLDAIDGLADDFQAFQSAGGCGKGGQNPLPVSFGSPHVRIRDCVVGGA